MAQFAAGERLTASKLSITQLQAVCSTSLEPTTTATDLPGATLTFTTTRANVKVRATCVADCEGLGATTNTGTLVVVLDVDGVDQTPQCLWAGTNDVHRGTVTQTWVVTLAAAGSHTLKLQARRSGGVQGESRVNSSHSTLTLIVEDNVA